MFAYKIKIDLKIKWLLALVLIVSAGGVPFGSSSDGRNAVSEADPEYKVADPSSMFADRSPGARDPGALFQTKPLENLMAAAAMPTAPQTNAMEASPLPPFDEVPRAFLAIARPADASESGDFTALPIPIGAIADAAPRTTIDPFLPELRPLETSPFVRPAGIVPGDPETPVGGVSGVPEPSTWATMLVGFFAIGGVIRRARRAPAAASRATPGITAN